jgi:very-short-patch-repair endonuclease
MTEKEKAWRREMRKRRRNLEHHQTEAEKKFGARLEALGVYFMAQKGFVAKGFSCIVDFYFPAPSRLCIEIDGGYHSTPKQIDKDAAKDRYLEDVRGFRIWRIKNDEVETVSDFEILRHI